MFDFPFAGSDQMKFFKKEFTSQQKVKMEEEMLKDSAKYRKKLSPITAKMRSKLVAPWNTKKYTINNSQRQGFEKIEQDSLGIFPSKRRSLGGVPRMNQTGRNMVDAMNVTAQSGRSISVKHDKKLTFTQTQSHNAFKFGFNQDKTTVDNTSGQFSKEKTKQMNKTANDTFKSIGENVKAMTPRTKQREIKRITSNLPEVYNKYFFTVDNDGTKHMQQSTITNLKRPFDLHKT